MACSCEQGHSKAKYIWSVGDPTQGSGSLQLPAGEPDCKHGSTEARGKGQQSHPTEISCRDGFGSHHCPVKCDQGRKVYVQGQDTNKTGRGSFGRTSTRDFRPWSLGSIPSSSLSAGTSEVLPMPEVRASQSHLSAPRGVRSMQWKTCHTSVHTKTHCQRGNSGKVSQLQREPPCVESQMSSQVANYQKQLGKDTGSVHPLKSKGQNPHWKTVGDINPCKQANGESCKLQGCCQKEFGTNTKATETKTREEKDKHTGESQTSGLFVYRGYLTSKRPGPSYQKVGQKDQASLQSCPDITTSGSNQGGSNTSAEESGAETNGNADATSQGEGERRGEQAERWNVPYHERYTEVDDQLRESTGIAVEYFSATATNYQSFQGGNANSYEGLTEQESVMQSGGEELVGQQSNLEPRLVSQQLNERPKPLKILQWNLNSFRAKRAALMVTAKSEDIDIIMLQETLVKQGLPPTFSGYRVFSDPRIPQQTRGCMILVKNSIPSQRIDSPISCGNMVETQAVKIFLADQSLICYNIYKQHGGDLDISELMAEAESQPIIIGGDFNAHHPRLNSVTSTNVAGTHIIQTLDETSGLTLLNNGEPTHINGGRLDLTFLSEVLTNKAHWEVHQTLTSDHFAVLTTLELQRLPPPPPPPKKWNHKKADWSKFKQAMDDWLQTYVPAEQADQLESDIVRALQHAADVSMPIVGNSKQHHKDHWYYCAEVKELNARINRVRKLFRKRRTDENYALLREVANHVCERSKEICHDKWLEWCAMLNEHTYIGDLWKGLKRIAGKRTERIVIPQPEQEANRLAELFANRTSSNNLPAATRSMQERLDAGRWVKIEEACNQVDDTDRPFTLRELRLCKHKGKDTAPGSDGITYSMIANMGEKGEELYLRLVNLTWVQRSRPRRWNEQDTQPIPKPKDPGNPRPISLISCLEKTAEKMVLRRMKWKVGELDPSLYAYREGLSTTQCITDILATINDRSAVVLFLDLEKAFELANPAAFLEALVDKGVKGHMLHWTKKHSLNRRARVKFQGVVSEYKDLQNGTPQGGILSPFLFNLLVERIAKMQLPGNAKLFIFADDITAVCTGRDKVMTAQEVLRRIELECRRLGLKINPAKTKAMAVKNVGLGGHLTLENQRVEWVKEHMVLGIWLDSMLTFHKQVSYLRERTNARLAPMRYITGLRGGANYNVLRTFYLHAIRPIVEYSAPALAGLSDAQIRTLEVAQNNALRLILGGPMWIRICNLQYECNIPPLYSRIMALNVCIIAKALSQQRDAPFKTRVKIELRRNINFPIPNTWLAGMGAAARACNMCKELLDRKSNCMFDLYRVRAPWEDFPAQISYTKLPASKANCTEEQLQRAARESIQQVRRENRTEYFTDGSVDRNIPAAGAGVYSSNFTGSWRLSDHCSTLQTELVAILKAIEYAVNYGNGETVIHTDSKAAMQAIVNEHEL